MTTTRSALLALAAAATVAGCGDDSDESVSRADYIAQANASCTKHERLAGAAFRRIIPNGRPTPAQSQRFVSEAVLPAIRKGVAERAKLAAPDGDAAKIAAINAAASRAVAGFERIAASTAQSHALMQGRLRDPATEVDRLNRRYGIDKCAGGN